MSMPATAATKVPNSPSPQDMNALVSAGTSSLANGDLRGALTSFEKVVNAFPDSPEGHNNLGALYTSMGEHERAEACFNKVIEILPENPSIYYNRGMARSSQEKFDTARSDFLVVLEHDPKDTDCLNNLGVMDFMQGKFWEAKLRFRQALEIQPGYSRALLNLCDVEMAQGNAGTAVELCENFLKNYDNIEVSQNLLDMLVGGCRKALDKASRTAEQLLVQGTDNPALSHRLQTIQQAKAALEENAEI